MCCIEPATPRTWKCRHTTLEPEVDTPRMCINAFNTGQWCDQPYERASKGSTTDRLNDCPECRNKKKRPGPKGDDGGTGAGGSTSTFQAQQSGIAVGA